MFIEAEAMLRIILCATAVLMLAGSARADDLEDAREAFKAGRVGRAVKLFSDHLKAHPDDAAAYLGRGAAQFTRKEHGKALADFDKAIELDATSPTAFADRAKVHIARGDDEKALADFGKSLSLDGEGRDAAMRLVNRGDVYVRLARLEEALADFNRAVEIAPRLGLARSARGYATLRIYGIVGFDSLTGAPIRGFPAEKKEETALLRGAMDDLDKGIEDSPKSARAHTARGIVRLSLQVAYLSAAEREKGYDDLAKAIELAPKSPDAYIARAKARMETMMVSQYFQAADGRTFMRQEFKADRDVMAKVLADADHAIEAAPERRDGYALRARCRSELGEYAKAAVDREQACRLQPNDGQAWNDHAWILATHWSREARDGAKAVEAATKACELAKFENPYWLDTLAAAHAEAGDFAKAVETQNKALELLPKEQDGLKPSFEERRKRFEQKKPYHDPAPKKPG